MIDGGNYFDQYIFPHRKIKKVKMMKKHAIKFERLQMVKEIIIQLVNFVSKNIIKLYQYIYGKQQELDGDAKAI